MNNDLVFGLAHLPDKEYRRRWPICRTRSCGGIADKMPFLVAATAAELERDLISERTREGLDAPPPAASAAARPR
ncbi:hypothetical protein [Nonomuraea cavernae]|uniref:Uncharacterized protein n=1 Tax=Nonomuraea cavernae TaxID=2045107 RepID=A0A917ZJ63_9ACTN|nr:hypothetical protein [Nonomuraea cavernae]MCA2189681.1 hypothetical protein [Nonomuraea cavernae]GGO83119.1 hypothetical protein GCM10012289_75930 [Nonomuraea cavernae]